MEHSTVRLGAIGETAVVHDIVKNYEYHLYTPVVDDKGVDLIIDRGDRFLKIQIKTVTGYNKDTSIEVRLRKYSKGDFDILSVYFEPKNIIAYVPFLGENFINLALKRAKNGQTKNRLWFYEFMEFPQK